MDDAGVPSLLGLPYLGYVSRTDPTYQRTRQFALSRSNPYYFEGAVAKGTGGPHIGTQTALVFCVHFAGHSHSPPFVVIPLTD
jgi:meiotically up-regulated gene 157 (Mug157) protein